jgi:hypothetical protein
VCARFYKGRLQIAFILYQFLQFISFVLIFLPKLFVLHFLPFHFHFYFFDVYVVGKENLSVLLSYNSVHHSLLSQVTRDSEAPACVGCRNLRSTYVDIQLNFFNFCSTYIQVTFNLHSTYIQVTFKLRSSYVQLTFNLHSSYVQLTFILRSTYVQPNFFNLRST